MVGGVVGVIVGSGVVCGTGGTGVGSVEGDVVGARRGLVEGEIVGAFA